MTLILLHYNGFRRQLMKVGIICAEGLEECEALLINDLLIRSGIKTKLIGLEKEIKSTHNLTFKCDVEIKDFDYQNYDGIILPGGLPGTYNLEKNKKVQEIIDYFASKNKLIAAICAAPSILIHKGLLKDNEFTCYPGFESGFKSKETKVTKHNNFITGKGLGAEFEFSYEIIKYLLNEEKAKETLKKIQY